VLHWVILVVVMKNAASFFLAQLDQGLVIKNATQLTNNGADGGCDGFEVW
jgi:hypothetical protein